MKATHAAIVARSDDDQPFMSEENSCCRVSSGGTLKC